MKILIFTESSSNRQEYVFQQVFSDWLGWSWTTTSQLKIWNEYQQPKIAYTSRLLAANSVRIPDSGFLQKKSIQDISFSTIIYSKIPALFSKNDPDSTFPFDLFANIFFHLSRYEEYLPFIPDQYGRFTAPQSWLFAHQALHTPVVDILVAKLVQAIQRCFPNVPTPDYTFRFQPTIDVDMAWAFRFKGWKRLTGGFLRDTWNGHFSKLQQRVQSLFNPSLDPFQTFDQLENWASEYHNNPVFFILLGDYGSFDKNNHWKNPAFQQLIRRLHQQYPVGIHPSFQSNDRFYSLKNEVNRFQQITGQAPVISRQHFLKLHFPQTYQHLLEAGIQHDFSMGYAEHTGYRAGTSRPFRWYDLSSEESMTLTIHPFQVMDVTLKNYLQLSPDEACRLIAKLMETSWRNGGTFCSIWHNSSFTATEGWENWDSVYEFLLAEAQKFCAR